MVGAERAGQRHVVDFLGVGAFGVFEGCYSAEGAPVLLYDLAGLCAFAAVHLGAFLVVADDSVESVFIAYLAVGVLLCELYCEILWRLDLLACLLLLLPKAS